MRKCHKEHAWAKEGDEHSGPKGVKKHSYLVVLPLDQLINPTILRVCQNISNCEVGNKVDVSKNLGD